MFRPSPMLRIDLLLMQKDLPAVTRGLAEAGILHLRPVRDLPVSQRDLEGAAGERIARLRAFAAKTQQVMSALQVEPPAVEIAIPGEELSQWERWLDHLAVRVGRSERRRRELVRLGERIDDLVLLMVELTGLEGGPAELCSLRFTSFSFGWLSEKEIKALAESGEGASVFPLHQQGEDILTAILGTLGRDPGLKDRLANAHFRSVELPCSMVDSFQEAAQRLSRLRARVSQRLSLQEARHTGLRVENEELLRSRLHSVLVEILLAETEAEFGYTERVVVLSGWLPKLRLEDLQSVLRQKTGDRFVLRQAAARGGETPVQFANPALLRPFQKILSVYGTPLFGEIEPTPLLAIGFVAMFGMMFGDLGQGLLLAAAGWLIRRWSRFREEGTVVIEVGFSAAFFGLLFGSFFGREDLFSPLWFTPLHNITLLMATAVAAGIALIISGLGLRIVNGVRLEKGLSLLTDRLGIAGLVFYTGSIATALLVWGGKAPAATLWWLLLPLAAIFCHPFAHRSEDGGRENGLALVLAEGAIEVLETVLGFFANTFSFLRLAAFGLAHAGLFMAIYAVAERVSVLPLGGMWVVAVHVLGNLVMVVLEGLVVSIQAVRLQFYEFFGKFFQGGGVPYHPLTLRAVTERRG